MAAFCFQRVTDAVMYIYQTDGEEGVNCLHDLTSTMLSALAEGAYYKLGDILDTGIKKKPPLTLMVFLDILFILLLLWKDVGGGGGFWW